MQQSSLTQREWRTVGGSPDNFTEHRLVEYYTYVEAYSRSSPPVVFKQHKSPALAVLDKTFTRYSMRNDTGPFSAGIAFAPLPEEVAGDEAAAKRFVELLLRLDGR